MQQHWEKIIAGVWGVCLMGLSLVVQAQVAPPATPPTYYPVQELLTTGKTIVGEDIRYPLGDPQITVSLITIAPGADASFHRHPAPLVAYILEGEVTVDYGHMGSKTYRAGDAFVEAMQVPHKGMNQGTVMAKLLAVNIGAKGTANVLLEKK
jgi:quercetin dioxygenase-like cupin family protein